MTPERPAYQKRISYQATLLGGFATVSTVALLMGDITTGDTIKQRLAEDLQASLQQVILPEMHDNNLLQDKLNIDHGHKAFTVYRGTSKGKVSALAYEVSESGYSGDIKLIMGVSRDGSIIGVRVLSHTETPGLGDKIEISKSHWIRSFDTLSLDNTPALQWAVKKDGGRFDQFSGATITPRAVVKAVRSGLDFFKTNKDRLLAVENKPAANNAGDKQGEGK